jgi:hypothetical protein
MAAIATGGSILHRRGSGLVLAADKSDGPVGIVGRNADLFEIVLASASLSGLPDA